MPIKSRNEIEAIKAPISPNKLCNNLYILIQKPLVFILLDRLLGASLYNDDFIAIRLKTEKDKASINIEPIIYSYLFDISQYILLPIYSFIRLFVYSFDVIHTLGFYSWGIKIDAIPGRINLGTTLRLLWKGEYRGKCFELCGQGHLSMLLLSIVL